MTNYTSKFSDLHHDLLTQQADQLDVPLALAATTKAYGSYGTTQRTGRCCGSPCAGTSPQSSRRPVAGS